MRFFKIFRQSACFLALFTAAVMLVHLLGALGVLAGGPLLGLAGYFVGITLLVSVAIWVAEQV
jgi:hypothetical protein